MNAKFSGLTVVEKKIIIINVLSPTYTGSTQVFVGDEKIHKFDNYT